MIVYTYDSNGFYLSQKYETDDYKLEANETNVFMPPADFYQPKFDASQKKWVEGKTAAELFQITQSNKINQIREAYNQTLASGFSISIGSTSYTFGWTSDDMTHMNATQTAISKGFLTFPFLYADVNGSPVSIPDQATLDSIEEEATKFMMAQHQQGLTLAGEVQSATTKDEVNAINWSPASY